jgi:hypothetical protein
MSAALLAARLFFGGILKGIWQWLCKRSPLELLAMFLIIVVIWLWISRGHALSDAKSQRTRADTAEKSLGVVCQATRKAAARPHLDCRQSSIQIGFLGSAIGELKFAIGSQNARIQALAARTATLQASAADAERRAAPRVQRALSASERLKASAAQAPTPEQQCKPSEELERSWR